MELPQPPIQKHYNPYPKDFTPGKFRKNILQNQNLQPSNKYLYNQQYSFNQNQQYNCNHKSVRLHQNHQIHDIAVQTLNPQFNNNRQQDQKPLRKQSHQIPKIKIQQKSNQIQHKQLFRVQNHQTLCIPQTSQQYENTPGSIKKQPFTNQIPLHIQQPLSVEVKTAQKISQLKMNSVNSKFIDNFNKSQSHFIRSSPKSQQKKLPGISRGQNQEGSEGSYRLNKKFSIPNNGRKATQLLNLSASKQGLNQSLNRKKTMFFNHTKISQINQQISLIMQKRREKLSPPKQTENSQNVQQNQYIITSKHSNRIFYSKKQEKQGKLGWRTSDFQKTSRNKDLFNNKTNTNINKTKQATISYKTSLVTLKDLLNVKDGVYIDGQIKLPKILRKPLFNKNHNRVQIFQLGCKIFEELGIKIDNVIVKKYSNCVLIVNRNISLLWHFQGRVYLGQWQTEYLDQGFRHGLGIQWIPNQSIYYGQFSKNKKDGLGVMKRVSGDFYVGLWNKGKPFGFGRTYCLNGQILSNKRNNSSESQQQNADNQGPFNLFRDQ